MEVFIASKELIVNENADEQRIFQLNEQLAEMMISNLLSNAIKYNKKGGQLNVEMYENYFVVSNSGDVINIPEQQIFERFKKGTQKDSVGLGLAIVKKICDHFNLKINYSYENHLHTFIIEFPYDIIVG